MKNISQQEWEDQLSKENDVIVLDVRTPMEYAMGSLPNAVNLDVFETENFLAEADKLDRSKNLYVYCRSGARSANACRLLEDLGFENVHNLLGGIMAWQN